MTQATQTRTLADIDADLARLQEERQALQSQSQPTPPAYARTLTWEEQQGGKASSILDGQIRRYPSGAVDQGMIRLGPSLDQGENILRRLEFHRTWAEQIASDARAISQGQGFYRWPERIYGRPDGVLGFNDRFDRRMALAFLQHRALWHKQAIDRLDIEARTATSTKARSSTVRQAALERLAKVLNLKVAAL